MAEKSTISGKERHFCEEYILDYNATAAAIRAGYPEKSAAKRGCLLLKRTEIREHVLQLQKDRSERLTVGADFVMQETLQLLQKCTQAVPVTEWDYSEHKMVATGEYQLDSKGACRCLELLAKMTGADQKQEAVDEGPVYYHGEEEIPE